MPARGFSLLGAISVATLIALLLIPLPLARLRWSLGHAEYDVLSRVVGVLSRDLSPRLWMREACAYLAQRRAAPATTEAQATPPLTQVSAWQALARGVEYRVARYTARSGEEVRVHEVRVDPRRADLRVLYNGHAATVAATAMRTGALAAINACYFDEGRHPLGYLKIQGHVVNGDVASGSAFTAVFTMRGNVARVVPRANFDGHVVDTALQAGPRMVADGVATGGLRETRSFRQSGIAVTRKGDVVIYATDSSYLGITWQEMQRLLTASPVSGGIDARDVLNLDGGSSSQIYVRRGAGQDVSTGFPTEVPVTFAVFARR